MKILFEKTICQWLLLSNQKLALVPRDDSAPKRNRMNGEKKDEIVFNFDYYYALYL